MAIKESFTGYEMDLLALYLSGASSPEEDGDLADMLGSLDSGRYELYAEIARTR